MLSRGVEQWQLTGLITRTSRRSNPSSATDLQLHWVVILRLLDRPESPKHVEGEKPEILRVADTAAPIMLHTVFVP